MFINQQLTIDVRSRHNVCKTCEVFFCKQSGLKVLYTSQRVLISNKFLALLLQINRTPTFMNKINLKGASTNTCTVAVAGVKKLILVPQNLHCVIFVSCVGGSKALSMLYVLGLLCSRVTFT